MVVINKDIQAVKKKAINLPHGPRLTTEMSSPFAQASTRKAQSLRYVLPSLPHTSSLVGGHSLIFGQTHSESV